MWTRLLKFFRGKDESSVKSTPRTAANSSQGTRKAPIMLCNFSGLYGSVRLKLSDDEKKYLVSSFDAQSLSFAAMPNFNPHRINACHEAELILEHTRIPIWICFLERDKTLINCQIVRTPATWNQNVDGFLDPIRLGKKLGEIDQSFVQQTPEGDKMRWFRSGPTCDVYLFENSENTVSLVQIWWEKNLVEWSAKHGLRSGTVIEQDRSEESVVYKRSEAFRYHETIDADVVDWAYRFTSASILPKPIRKLFST